MRAPLLILAVSLTGCASLPDATIEYWPARAQSTITVVETYACTAGKTDFVVVATRSIVTTYSADTSGEPRRVALKGLEAWYASSTAGFTFTEDGRLKGFNGTSTGTGGEAVKEIVGIVTGIRTGSPDKSTDGFVPAPAGNKPLCDVIDQLGDPKTNTLTITRSATFDHKKHFIPDANGKFEAVDFHPDQATRFLYLAIEALKTVNKYKGLPAPADMFTKLDIPLEGVSKKGPLEKVRINPVEGKAANATQAAGTSPIDSVPSFTGPKLILNRVRKDSLLVTSTKYPGARAVDLRTYTPTVPDESTYEVPLSKPPFFGENQASIGLAESGELVSITYGAKSGIAGGLGALNQMHSLVNPSASTLAAEEKARADLIAQQKRLARCLRDPDNCTP